MAIGALGGTFDPVHVGHLSIAQQVRNKLGLARVLLIPAFSPPHKLDRDLAPPEDRLQMCRLAVQHMAGLAVADLEIRRAGVSFTVDTVRELKKGYPEGTRLVWLIGSDTLPELPTWRAAKTLVDEVDFAVVERKGFPAHEAVLAKLERSLGRKRVRKLRRSFVPIEAVDVSSSAVRERLAQGATLRGFLRRNVEEYLRHKGLYGCRKA